MIPALIRLSARVPPGSALRAPSTWYGSSRRDATRTPARRSSEAALFDNVRVVGSSPRGRVGIFISSRPRHGCEPRPVLDVLRVETPSDCVRLGDGAVLDQPREGLLQGDH